MIHFVGAGSGAVDLITVRGQKLLKEADIVVYAGSLVNPELLKNCQKDCQIYNLSLIHIFTRFISHRQQKIKKTTQKILNREAIQERANRKPEVAKTRNREMRTRLYWILESM